MNVQKIYERVVTWNALRYEQVYNHDLSVALLAEELQELYDAPSKVDELDALCDIIYVAMGVLWKANVSDDDIMSHGQMSEFDVNDLIEVNILDTKYLMSAVLNTYKYEKNYPICYAMQMMITLSLVEMLALGLDEDGLTRAMIIVCHSNDSKSVKRTASDVKANGNDKGKDFIRPEPNLRKLLLEYGAIKNEH